MLFVKDGEGYTDIIDARNAFCHACSECFMRENLQPGITCNEFCKSFPERAAALMGYSVVGRED